MDKSQSPTTPRFLRPAFYSDGVGAIDLAHYREDGCLVSEFEGETLEQIRLRYPNAEVMEFDDACDRHESTFKTAVSEIDEEQFFDALEVLPPQGWKTVDGVESFYMMERLSGNVSSIYARHGKRFFTFADVVPMSGAAIAERVKQFASA